MFVVLFVIWVSWCQRHDLCNTLSKISVECTIPPPLSFLRLSIKTEKKYLCQGYLGQEIHTGWNTQDHGGENSNLDLLLVKRLQREMLLFLSSMRHQCLIGDSEPTTNAFNQLTLQPYFPSLVNALCGVSTLASAWPGRTSLGHGFNLPFPGWPRMNQHWGGSESCYIVRCSDYLKLL